MTKNEKQVLLEKLEEYAVAYGYYLEQSKHEKYYDKDGLSSVAHDMQLIKDILKLLNVNYKEVENAAIEEGAKRWVYNHPIHIGAMVKTPRFCTVKISTILTYKEANDLGYTEPTHYTSNDWSILGKNTGANTMSFAAVKKSQSGQA